METSLVILIHYSHASHLFHDSRSLRVSAAEERVSDSPVGSQALPHQSLVVYWRVARKAQVEEFYVFTWDSPKEQIF
jgi:hypothetical protein